MKIGILRGLVVLAASMLSMQAMAVPIAVHLDAQLFSGLGRCDGTAGVSAPPLPLGACEVPQTVPVQQLSPSALAVAFPGSGWDAGDTNSYDSDLIYMHIFNDSVDSGALPATTTVMFDADSAAGQTGGGSAGPCVNPLDCGGSSPGVFHDITLTRIVFINGIANTDPIVQHGSLHVTWGDSDFLTLLPTSLDVVIPGEGILTIVVDGITDLKITADPPAPQSGRLLFTPFAVPLPSTLALLGLGLAGIAFRRRQAL